METYEKKIVDILVDYQVIKLSDKRLYEFGVCQGISLLINILTVIFIGVIFNTVCESILFTIWYTPIRCNAGGYHAKKRQQCYLYSIGIVIIALIIISLWQKFKIGLTITMLLLGTVIWFKSPVENKVKLLSAHEMNVYLKRTRIIVIIEFLLYVLFFRFKYTLFASTICGAVIIAGLMVILGITTEM